MTTTRIAVFADIHGNKEALMSIINDAEANNADKIVSLGDVVSIGPNSKECLEIIMQRNIVMVLGNHELYCMYGFGKDDIKVSDGEREHQKIINGSLDEMHFDFLKKSKMEYEICINSKLIYMCHYPMINNEFIENRKDHTKEYIHSILPHKNLAFWGHSHRQHTYKYKNNSYYNLPSAGCTSDNITNYMMISVSDKDIECENIDVVYDRNKFEKKINNSDYPDIEFIKKHFYKMV